MNLYKNLYNDFEINNKNHFYKKMNALSKVFFALTILWMIVIFIFSAQTGDTSASLSGGLTETFISIIFKNFNSYEPDKQLSILETAHFIIRKGAHFTEYAILGIFSNLTLLTYTCIKKLESKIKCLKNILFPTILYSFIFSVIYAVSDEIHQGFTANRYPAITDVLIDSCGALFGILFATIIFYKLHLKKVL